MRAALVLAALPFVVGAILRWPFLGIVLFVTTDFVRPQDLTWGFEEVRFALVVSLATLAAFLLSRRRFSPVRRPGAEPFLVALALAMLVSTATAAASVEVALEWNLRFFKIVVFCLLLARMVDGRARLESAVAAMVLGVGALAAWAFLQHFQGNERLEKIGNGGDQSSSNHLGAIFCLVLPLSVALARNAAPGSWTRRGALALVPVTIADVAFTQSRAAYLAVAALAGLSLAKREIRGKVLGWILVLGVLLAAGGAATYLRRAGTIVSEGTRGAGAADGSVSLRIVLWEHALELFSRSPVTGVGAMNSGLLVKDETAIGKVKSIHNTYLQLLADGGALGLALWLATLLAGWCDARAAGRAARARGDAVLLRYALALELGIGGFLAASCFHSFEYVEMPYWVVTLAGVVRGLGEREGRGAG